MLDQRIHTWFAFEAVQSTWPFVLVGVFAGAVFWLLACFRNEALDLQKGKSRGLPARVA